MSPQVSPEPFLGEPRPLLARLWLFALANYVVLAAMCWALLPIGRLEHLPTLPFLIALDLSYPAIYVLLAIGPVALLVALAERIPIASMRVRRSALEIASALAIVSATGIGIALYADLRTYAIFGFHLNGFVLNLLATPGGFASMGAGSQTVGTGVALAIGYAGAQSLLYWRLGRASFGTRFAAALISRRAIGFVAVCLVVLSGCERMSFGWSDLVGYRPILRQAEHYPLYLPLRFKRFARSLGIEVDRRAVPDLGPTETELVYPLEPLVTAAGPPQYNIVWLCAESLRGDALDPEIMPGTWQFAGRSLRFDRHFSGGNGTRMGMFSMFYGLPGRYWFSFLNERRGPVLIDVLRARGYEMQMFTSDVFTYPELSKTVFAAIPADELRELSDHGKSWERDRVNIGEVERFITERGSARPFFVFSFLESPHAPYDFPPESVIREPYLASFNYVSADLGGDIGQIHNRYINSVHHLDSQIDRLVAFLEQQGLMESTIVIVTGDHGEEFMEKGRWGHNSAFSDEQIRVPLVLWVPGHASGVVDRLTSHVDLPVTLLRLLGVTSDPTSYSTGLDLLGDEAHRYIAVSDWSSVVYVDPEVKIRFPDRSLAEVWSSSDVRLEDERPLVAARVAPLASMLADLGRFRRGR